MIKVVGINTEEVKYSVVYDKSGRVVNIESSSMGDEFIPYRESSGCLIWLSSEGTLGEIECIFPVERDVASITLSTTQRKVYASPKLSVSFQKISVEMYHNQSQVQLIFDGTKDADCEYVSANISFFTSEDELIAIVCSDYILMS